MALPKTITEAAAGLRDGTLSSVELVQEGIAAADALDGELGVYITRFDGQALHAAAKADAELASGVDLGPLHGIPLGIKDILAATEGPKTAQSVVLDPAWGQGKDAITVARLKQAGAIVPGKLSTMEYASGLHLMEPRDISKLLQGILPKAGERALAIAAPYAALVLAEIGLKVRLRLPEGVSLPSDLAGQGIEVVNADLAATDESGPYDVIVTGGAVHRAPEAWIALLNHDGRLGVVERDGPVGRARLYQRGHDGVVSDRILFDATPPMLRGMASQPAFQF